MEHIVYTAAAVSIVTHCVRTVYDVLKHEKIITPGRLSFVIIFTNMALLWISWFALCIVYPKTVILPDVARYAGLAVTVTGVIFFLTALFTIKTFESYTGGLITHGIYSRIRHPMYLGFILWLVGFPLCTGAVSAYYYAVPFCGNVLFWRYLEEKELSGRFVEYGVYRGMTWF